MVRLEKLLLQDKSNGFTRCLDGQLCRAKILTRERRFVRIEEVRLGEMRTGACIYGRCVWA
jgi:hypothetical protein